jgi:Uncharacterized enzyme of heme biosynthesis
MIKKRMIALLITVMLCIMVFPVTAFAGGGEDTEPTPTPEATTEEATPPPSTINPNPQTLTPDGNLTLVDDIDGEQAEDKQFITVVTKNGNYFYIIIDRAGDTDNVYFLNMVDEADLLALIEEMEDAPPTQTVVTPQPEPQQPTTPTEPEPDPEPEKKSGGMGGILAIVLILAAGGGAFYYLKILKPKQAQGGGTLTELDELDFDDDNDAAFDETIQRLAEQKDADKMEDYDEE